MFENYGLSEKLLKKIKEKGFEKPTPIQEQIIPLLLKGEKDVVGKAQTGTGKTGSFAIPLAEITNPDDNFTQSLILAPTRELAIQIANDISAFLDEKIKVSLVYGGQSIEREVSKLRRGNHILIGTPGRVRDHLKRGNIKLEKLKYFVLDEADEMLNIGFREEIEEILTNTPKEKKVLLFSATMPRTILKIAETYMKNYDFVEIKSDTKISPKISQEFYEVAPRNKFNILQRIIDFKEDFYGIIFCRTKGDTDDVTSALVSSGLLAEAIHGDVEQRIREKILNRFKAGKVKILVATDVAARGIDVADLNFVINYSLPENAEIYTHRIGRTGRAGRTGTAVSFVSRNDKRKLQQIERILKTKIKEGDLPSGKDLVGIKKKRFIEKFKKDFEEVSEGNYGDLVSELLEVGSAEKVLETLIGLNYKKDFDEKAYSKISIEKSNDFSVMGGGGRDRGGRGRDRGGRGERGGFEKRGGDRGFGGGRDRGFGGGRDRGFGGGRERDFGGGGDETRLFIAKGRADDMSPGGLIKFIEGEVGGNIGDVGKIEMKDNFSYMNVDTGNGDRILKHFKRENPVRPTVVQAKPRER